MGQSSDFLKSDIGRSLLPILSDAGFDQGDFLPIYTMGPPEVRSQSTTSTTYDNFYNHTIFWLQWSMMPLPEDNRRLYSMVRVMPGTDETVDVRWRNRTDGETIGSEITGITSTKYVDIGPIDYTPPTTDAPVYITWQVRTDPGANSSNLQGFWGALGVEL